MLQLKPAHNRPASIEHAFCMEWSFDIAALPSASGIQRVAAAVLPGLLLSPHMYHDGTSMNTHCGHDSMLLSVCLRPAVGVVTDCYRWHHTRDRCHVLHEYYSEE